MPGAGVLKMAIVDGYPGVFYGVGVEGLDSRLDHPTRQQVGVRGPQCGNDRVESGNDSKGRYGDRPYSDGASGERPYKSGKDCGELKKRKRGKERWNNGLSIMKNMA